MSATENPIALIAASRRTERAVNRFTPMVVSRGS
jgi:hypothetical protein